MHLSKPNEDGRHRPAFYLPKLLYRKLTHRRLRNLLCIVLLLLFLLTILILNRHKKIRMEMTRSQQLRKNCLRFINEAVDHCLKLDKREDQNRRFEKIKTELPIRPIKMTATTAVFHFKTASESYVIKRIIVNEEWPTQEDSITLALKHKNIINAFDSEKEYFVNHKNTRQVILWLFVEYLKERISLSSVDKDEDVIRMIMRDVLKAIAYMHDTMNMVHLDLKIANIMGTKDSEGITYKLIDFGYSRGFKKESAVKYYNVVGTNIKKESIPNKKYDNKEDSGYHSDINEEIQKISGQQYHKKLLRVHNKIKTEPAAHVTPLAETIIPNKSYGTFPYKPPEIVFYNIHGKQSDIWCIGCIAWFLSMKDIPFYKPTSKGGSRQKDTNAYRDFLRGESAQFFDTQTTLELQQFIRICMNLDRNARPTAKELLEHPFITGKTMTKASVKEDPESGYDSYSSSSELTSE